MSRPRRDDADTPADHWKNRIVQRTTRLPSREDFRTKPGSSARSRRHWSLIVRYLVVAVFFGAAGTVAYMAWDGFTGDATASAGAADIGFTTDGVITKKWVLDRLTDEGKQPLPPIFDIKRNLEAEPQIREVTVRRLAGGSLSVDILERSPVLRMMVIPPGGIAEPRLISSEGVIYTGINIGQMTYSNLPQLVDVKDLNAKGLMVHEANFDRIAGFAPIAAFLDLARIKYNAVYRDWKSVSLREYPGRPEPSAVIFVKPHLSTQSPDSAAIVEIVFSSQDYAEELDRLANPAVSEAIRQKLRAVDRTKFPQYRLDLSLVNSSNPRYPVPELHLIPVPVAPRQP